MADGYNVGAIIVVAIVAVLYIIGLCLFLSKKRKNTSIDYQNLIGDSISDLNASYINVNPENMRTPEKSQRDLNSSVINIANTPDKKRITNERSADDSRTDRSDIDLLNRSKYRILV